MQILRITWYSKPPRQNPDSVVGEAVLSDGSTVTVRCFIGYNGESPVDILHGFVRPVRNGTRMFGGFAFSQRDTETHHGWEELHAVGLSDSAISAALPFWSEVIEISAMEHYLPCLTGESHDPRKVA